MQNVCRAGGARNRIKNCCFRTLILKLVNSLESLEERIAIHIGIDFFLAPLVLMAWQQLFLFSKAAQHGLATFVACSRGRGLSGFVTSQTQEVACCSPYQLFL